MIKSVLFYFGHPAQYLFARNTIKNLKEAGVRVSLIIKTKDVLEYLIQKDDHEYTNILPAGRADGILGVSLGLVSRNLKILRLLIRNRVDLLVGTDPSLAHVGYILRIPSITTLEDDFDVIPKLAKITYPFTTHIFTPRVCKVGEQYEFKKLPYSGYMKLAYLHPKYFKPDENKTPKIDTPYILIRLAKLTAHHDKNIEGLNFEIIDKINSLVKNKFKVFINSEYELPIKYEHQRLNTKIEDIHHILSHCSLFISDSQSMTVEAAVLGVPSIRYSDFTGRISVLDELENLYLLTTSVKPPNEKLLLEKVQCFLNDDTIKEKFQERRMRMLNEKIDVTEALTNLVLQYPESISSYKS